MGIPKKQFDSENFGKMAKNARQSRGLTRNTVAEKLNITPRYLMSIENNGQTPSLQVFYDLVTLFEISADGIFYNGSKSCNSPRRRHLEDLLGQVCEADLQIVEGTVQGILKTYRNNGL